MHLILANQYLGQVSDTDLQGEILANTDIKIAGINDAETARKIITSLKLSADTFSSLKEHQFFIKTNDRTAFKVNPPGILVTPKHYTTRNLNPYLLHPHELQELKDYQYQHSGYYIPLAPQDKKSSKQ